VDRRSFITTLIGGLTAASFGGVAVAAARETAPVTAGPLDDGVKLDAEALDKTDAEFSQYYYRRRPYYRRRYYYRPRYYRPRYYRRRRYYSRPRYYRRRW